MVQAFWMLHSGHSIVEPTSYSTSPRRVGWLVDDGGCHCGSSEASAQKVCPFHKCLGYISRILCGNYGII